MDPEYAARYADLEAWHWWFRARQRILDEVLRRALGDRGPLAIASVGAGPASALGWLVSLAGPGGRVVSLDLDPIHAAPDDGRLACVVGSVESAPLRSARFDVVLALDVLEHLDHDASGLYEAARLLRPGGLLLVTVPALQSLWGPQDIVNRHRRRYTKRTLRETYRRAGLPVPQVTYFNTLLFPPIAAVRWARRALPPPGEVRGDFELSRPGVVNELLTWLMSLERLLVGRVPLPVGTSLLAASFPRGSVSGRSGTR